MSVHVAIGSERCLMRRTLPQASCLNPLLVVKVREWAAACGGCFPLAQLPGHFSSQAMGRIAPFEEGLNFKWAKVAERTAIF